MSAATLLGPNLVPRYFPFEGQAAAAAAGIQGRHPSLPRESHSQLHTQSLTREQNATDGRTDELCQNTALQEHPGGGRGSRSNGQ